MSCRGIRLILEAAYPADVDLLSRLGSRGLVDAAFLPDLPLGLVNVDSLAASLALQAEHGVDSLAASSLGQRSSAASASRIMAAYALGLRGVVLVAGDVRACQGRMGVLDAVSLAASLPDVNLPEGLEASSTIRDSLRQRQRQRQRAAGCFEVGCAVDLGNPDSMRLAAEKVKRGATILLSQLVPRPMSMAQQVTEAMSWGATLAIGIPYAETDGAATRFEGLIGVRPPRPRTILDELGSLVERMSSRPALYISPLGKRDSLEGFLEEARSLVS